MRVDITQTGYSSHDAVDGDGTVLSSHARQDQAIETVVNAGGGEVRTGQVLRVAVTESEPVSEPAESEPEPEPAPSGAPGPDGTHWPDNTPAPWAAADATVNDLGEIGQSLIDTVGAGGTIVVRDGISTGDELDWDFESPGSQNVLIRAATLQGHTIDRKIRFETTGIVLSGFTVDASMDIRATRTFLARSVVTYDGQHGIRGTDCGWYEVVKPDYHIGSDLIRFGDSSDVPNPTGIRIVGCYLKPTWKESGSSDHCDNTQIWCNYGAYQDLLCEDSVLFTAADKVHQGENGQAVNAVWRNCWMNSPAHRTEEPLEGSETKGYSQSVSGPGDNFLVEDCTIVGSFNHKGDTTGNTGTFRRSNIRAGTALDMNDPTIEDCTIGDSVTLDNYPMPPIADLATIWGP